MSDSTQFLIAGRCRAAGCASECVGSRRKASALWAHDLSRYKQTTVSVCFWFGVIAFFTAVFGLLQGFLLLRIA